ncbi:DNA polymerase III subunit chi [Allorhizobium taibaishanense]|uniref:DNA polymerase III subunit chi n=1 Tax=Allorhizobium taibaishanense TaxID=887144 RepID=A0A1Q8ZZ07_9HYPH|nr:DNA polymerase III subunit chi [Allorhizobium taibaishanense]MBB4007475.1 DNA polymerase-3 subunit chi [Allorhizobium taibaishanense]OLP47574.1 DNA polymerase III subunit chi [Allorhizobium taibaishanense]
MTDVLFYHLTETRLEDALPALLEKSLERGWKVGVEMRDPGRCERLDQHLWSYRDDSFLAHGTDSGERPEAQPILLSLSADNPNGATVRFYIDGAVPDLPLTYERVVFVFDGHDQAELETARGEWKRLKGEGHALTYWQQNNQGRWEKKA